MKALTSRGRGDQPQPFGQHDREGCNKVNRRMAPGDRLMIFSQVL